MGRKIRGRKHRGVRDMEKQQWQREADARAYCNMPPRNRHVQEVPKSFWRMMDLRAKCKPDARHYRYVPTNDFGESFDSAADSFDLEPYKKKTGTLESILITSQTPVNLLIDIAGKNDENRGAQHSFKIPARKYQSVGTALRKNRNKVQTVKKAAPPSNKAKKRAQKLAMKAAAKKKMKIEDLAEVKREHVAFGEVAHQPPNFVQPKLSRKEARAQLLYSNLIKSLRDDNVQLNGKNKGGKASRKRPRYNLRSSGFLENQEEMHNAAIKQWKGNRKNKNKNQKNKNQSKKNKNQNKKNIMH